MESLIPFNKPFLTGKELHYISDAANSGKLSGNGKYTNLCQNFFAENYNFKKCLLTTSCTDALEMAAILAGVKKGDEVIIPSYTFVSTALAFIRQGANVVFADSLAENPNINPDVIEELITEKTKVIVPVHYAGVACDMEKIMNLANKYNLLVIEDAAQAINNYYVDKNGNKKALGSLGHMSTFSFHETKNIISGEGGMLVVNDERFVKRSEIIWEKGTNRSEFFRGEVNKYGWVDTGSSFLPSEVVAAFLWAQIENIEIIQNKRISIWNYYYEKLYNLSITHDFRVQHLPPYSTNNAHMFYVLLKNSVQRESFIQFLKTKGILSVFHYLSLHKSQFYSENYPDYSNKILKNSDMYTDCLVRLPFFYDLSFKEIDFIIEVINDFFKK